MKTYIQYLVLAAVAVLVVGLSACDKSNEPGSGAGKLVGSWQYTGTLAAFSAAFGGQTYVQFREDGTAVAVNVSKDLLDEEIEIKVHWGTYKREGNKLIGTDELGDTQSAVIKELTEEKLVVSAVVKVEGRSIPFEVELTRVSDDVVNDWIRKAQSQPKKPRSY